MREITLQQLSEGHHALSDAAETCIPRRLVRYWHDPSALPDDVRACLETWSPLAEEGFEFHTFDDVSATSYIAAAYGTREQRAFARCGHPAMRADYLRMCFVLAEGGFYVDADDVLTGDGWRRIFRDGKLKLQPLCYDLTARSMLPSAEIWRADLPTKDRIFYVNNDPIAAPAGHAVLRRALAAATAKLLDDERFPDIQSTTGPGNLTSALAAHAYELQQSGAPRDFALLRDWDAIAEMRWDLSYRRDARNWRNVYGC